MKSTDPGFEPLRVVMVCSSSIWGGTEKWTLHAAEELASRGHRVDLITRCPDLFTSRRNNLVSCRANLRISRLPLRNDIDLVSVFRLADYLARVEAEVMIPTRVRDYWLGGMAAQLARVPELLRLGVVRRPRDGYWRDRLRYGRWPTATLVNARAIRDELARSALIDVSRVHVIYNGVEAPGPVDADARRTMRREFGVGDDNLFIASAGRLAAEKRWNWWLEVVAAVRKAGVSVKGVLLGEGAERSALESRCRELGLDDGTVQLPGIHPEAARVLGAADLVVMTSLAEGVSNSMLEALGRQVAVVATAAGGAAEVLKHERDLLLVDPADRAGLIAAVARVADDETLRLRLAAAGLETVRREFSWRRSGDELEALLRSVAGRPAGTSRAG